MAYYEGEINSMPSNNGGFFGGNGWGDLAALIVVAGLFGGFGGGFGFGGNAGANANYVLSSDFATIQRQLSDGFSGVEKGLDTIRNGLCDGFYTTAQQFNTTNTNILTGVNNITSAIADCCCKTQTAIQGVNYNMSLNTRDIIENANANYRALHDELVANKLEAKNDIIARQNDEINALRLRASQEAQNNYLVNALRPCPVPAFLTCNPFANCGCGGSSIQ